MTRRTGTLNDSAVLIRLGGTPAGHIRASHRKRARSGRSRIPMTWKRRQPRWIASSSGGPGRRLSVLSICASTKGTTTRRSRWRFGSGITRPTSAIAANAARSVNGIQRVAGSSDEQAHGTIGSGNSSSALRNGWRIIEGWYISRALSSSTDWRSC